MQLRQIVANYKVDLSSIGSAQSHVLLDAACYYLEGNGITTENCDLYISKATRHPEDPLGFIFEASVSIEATELPYSFFIEYENGRVAAAASVKAVTSAITPLEQAMPEVSTPPQNAKFLLWFLPRAQRDDVLGDCAEDYQLVLESFGKRKADFWYWSKVLLEVGPFLREHLFTTWLGELIKQLRSK